MFMLKFVEFVVHVRICMVIGQGKLCFFMKYMFCILCVLTKKESFQIQEVADLQTDRCYFIYFIYHVCAKFL